MSSYGDNIRRIAKYQELLDLIQSKTSKVNQVANGAILGARGVAYAVPGTQASTPAKGTPGASKPNNEGNKKGDATKAQDKREGEANPVSGAVGEALNALDKSGSSDDLASLDNTKKDGYFDVDSVIDAAKDTLDKAPPRDGQTVNSITGLKDGSRNLIVHLRDADTSFIAPSSWDSLTDIPADSSFVQGKIWMDSISSVTSNTFGGWASKFQRAFSGAVKLYTIQEAIPFSNSIITSTSPQEGEYLLSSGNLTATVGQTVGVVGGTGVPYVPGNNVFPGYGHVDCSSISSPTPSQSASCALTAPDTSGGLPANALWPDLLVTQLGWISPLTGGISPYTYAMVGKFIAHPYDTNVPSKFQNGVSVIDAVSQQGTNVRVGPLRDGGFYVYERDPSNSNLPLGSTEAASVAKINPDRTWGGYITPSLLSKILPK